ncbi:PLC-like phosphodiesterase [Diplogelasinospora grovesii]|uniref:PLC-like phosphodiesterase n=1 Tax=Diplogelasinospora grovesii TaxID=303347 RepID=A0AAN6NJ18_9PEZI|nr:PLC-like phosphodiesterase [Diplogelasinospora grovesii]
MIADCEWDYLSTLRTVREPPEALPRLRDLLEYLAQPGLEHVWVLLDIKTDDDGEELLSQTAKTIASVPSPGRAWKERIVLGPWNANYIQFCRERLPGFPIAYVGFSLFYASKFLKEPNVNFNMLQQTLVGPVGSMFITAVKKAERNLYVWTVNDEHWMEWSIKKQVDGVITDDPKLFLEVCERWKKRAGTSTLPAGLMGREESSAARRVKLYAHAFMMQMLVLVLTGIFWRRFITRGGRNRGKGVKIKT